MYIILRVNITLKNDCSILTVQNCYKNNSRTKSPVFSKGLATIILTLNPK